ncbi:hypothetical protein [Microbulbifer guangxiensis]|uniref:hypothetical protein n=1 Tax=Microbulbifer guangxiensis TaxID=2904249 RepID=UPI001F31747C|nr:hypothetical protein [Microbulbifer guangxiensis]
MNTDRTHFLSEVEARLLRLFSCSKSGYRISPQERHRLEGFMQAGVFLGLTDNSALGVLMERCHQTVFNKSIAERRAENPINAGYERIDYSPYEQPAYTRRRSCRRQREDSQETG